MDLKLVVAALSVAGVLAFVSMGSQPFSSFLDFQGCDWQKVEIQGNTFQSKSELKAGVLERGGQEAWNEIQSNVADWKTKDGELYIKHGECDGLQGGS